jgi:hypothetical protein
MALGTDVRSRRTPAPTGSPAQTGETWDDGDDPPRNCQNMGARLVVSGEDQGNRGFKFGVQLQVVSCGIGMPCEDAAFGYRIPGIRKLPSSRYFFLTYESLHLFWTSNPSLIVLVTG